MRLDPQQKAALEKALENVEDEVYLFGSRIDEDKKGGDIDILIFSKQDPFKLSQEVSIRNFRECEEKIDVVVMDKDNLSEEQKAFLNQIKMERLK
jgi:predicted nucleotidyltransferase